VLLSFYQDGCPYCAKLLNDNFGDRALADKTRRGFDVIAINLWGDRLCGRLPGDDRRLVRVLAMNPSVAARWLSPCGRRAGSGHPGALFSCRPAGWLISCHWSERGE